MIMATIAQVDPRLQAAVDAALAKYPFETARLAKAADLVARDFVIPPTATDPAWRVGPARWQVFSATPGQCDCPDYLHRRQMCKHIFSVWLYRKMQQTPSVPPVPPAQSLQFYGTWHNVAGIVTVYNSGDIQATFQPESAACPVVIPMEDWFAVVLAGRKDLTDAAWGSV